MELGNMLFGNSRGSYPISRDEVMLNNFIIFLENLGLDSYGQIESNVKSDFIKEEVIKEKNSIEFIDKYYEDERFIIRPYYWGDNLIIQNKPNFIDKKDGITISWYKYPFRDSYINKKININDYMVLLREIK